LTRVTKDNVNKLQSIISGIEDNGGTTINTGMTQAFEVIKQRKYQNEVTSVFLLTDG